MEREGTFERCICPQTLLSLLLSHHKVSSFIVLYAPRYDVLPHYSIKAMKPGDCGLKSVKPWAKTGLSSLKMFISSQVFCHSNLKLTNTLCLSFLHTQTRTWLILSIIKFFFTWKQYIKKWFRISEIQALNLGSLEEYTTWSCEAQSHSTAKTQTMLSVKSPDSSREVWLCTFIEPWTALLVFTGSCCLSHEGCFYENLAAFCPKMPQIFLSSVRLSVRIWSQLLYFYFSVIGTLLRSVFLFLASNRWHTQ
jgi:hypothetical protein